MPTITSSRLKLIGISFLIFWAPLFLFSAIAGEVAEHTPLPGDIAILEYIHHHFSTRLSSLFMFFTDIGSAPGIVAIVGSLVAYAWFRNHRRAGIILLVSVGGAALANFIIKLIYRRPRPELWRIIANEPGFSFPSGHAMASSALAFSLIYIFWNTRWRWLVTVAALLFTGMVSLSRLYFGVHYPSDIIGGWLASFLWVSLVVVLMTHRNAALLPKRLFDRFKR